MLNYYTPDKLEVGIDEAGRGCLAGPVSVASVIWPKDLDEIQEGMPEIKDSKKISRKNRSILKEYIEANAIDWNVELFSNEKIDNLNILNATTKAMHRSLDNMNVVPELILVDGNKFDPYYDLDNNLIENVCIIGGDNKYKSIACASILAKEYHDQYIRDIVKNDPELDTKYDWLNNVCYGTSRHLEGIKKYGISKYHRKSFGICKRFSKS